MFGRVCVQAGNDDYAGVTTLAAWRLQRFPVTSSKQNLVVSATGESVEPFRKFHTRTGNMAQVGPYSKPPLTEALLDIQVELPPEVSVAELERCHEKVKNDYPNSSPIHQAFARIEVGGVATSTTQPYGFRFATADGLQLFQARRDGFTHNRLAPYNGWDDFRTEARRLWSVYRGVAKPVSVKRVAVRYINRLDLPQPVIDLKDYLRTSPEVSQDLPQAMAGFFMQVTLPLPDIKALVNLTETLAEPTQPNTVSVVFDLDLYRTDELPTDEGSLWELLEAFREKKDAVFEACITEKTRGLIK